MFATEVIGHGRDRPQSNSLYFSCFFRPSSQPRYQPADTQNPVLLVGMAMATWTTFGEGDLCKGRETERNGGYVGNYGEEIPIVGHYGEPSWVGWGLKSV